MYMPVHVRKSSGAIFILYRNWLLVTSSSDMQPSIATSNQSLGKSVSINWNHTCMIYDYLITFTNRMINWLIKIIYTFYVMWYALPNQSSLNVTCIRSWLHACTCMLSLWATTIQQLYIPYIKVDVWCYKASVTCFYCLNLIIALLSSFK